MAIFGMLALAVNVYSLVCVARILLSWFPGAVQGTPLGILRRITDPWLDLFRGFRFLRIGGIDFSPVAAISVLSVFATVLSALGHAGYVTVGIVLAVVFRAFWSIFAFLLSFFALLAFARLVSFLLGKNGYHPVWRAVDSMLNPALWAINRLLFRDRIVKYRTSLVSGFLLFLGLRIGLGALADLAAAALASLPF